jgi:hypothetical protein
MEIALPPGLTVTNLAGRVTEPESPDHRNASMVEVALLPRATLLLEGQLLLSLDDHLAAAGALNRRRLALHTQLQMRRETRKEAAGCVCRRVDLPWRQAENDALAWLRRAAAARDRVRLAHA